MAAYRVHKYHPRKCDVVSASEWTSVHDIESMSANKLTAQIYTDVERSYIALMSAIFILSGEEYFYLRDFEGDSADLRQARDFSVRLGIDEVMPISIRKIKSKHSVSLLPNMARLVLREHVWGRIVGGKGTVIDFGYDYYCYFSGCLYENFFGLAASLGLVAESIDKSPYDIDRCLNNSGD